MLQRFRPCASCRCLLLCVIAAACAAVLVRAVVLEPFDIPTGSMAPTLRGRHHVCVCPRCGHEVVVGRALQDDDGDGTPRHYRKAYCGNCGLLPIPVTQHAEQAGDRVLVNKCAFGFRQPRRWEIVVFRLLDALYIKRVLGLSGETVLIHDGDVYIDSQLARKTYAEAKAMRMLVFEEDKAPAAGWSGRWQRLGSAATWGMLDGRDGPDERVYANFCLDTGKCEPIRDEYEYSVGLHANSACVHDFLIETDIEVHAGAGTLRLWLDDGGDKIEVELATPGTPGEQARRLNGTLLAGRRYRVEMALVDRRLSVAIDGRLCLTEDLPEAKARRGVARPFGVRADGLAVSLHAFRLFRDIHYGRQGHNGVGGKSVTMGVDQIFVAGDNSPCSRDSRWWPDHGAVPTSALVGSVIRP